ncbi:NUMOD1 domain-containing DNA-binding protein [Bacillus toyonensis]|uniref:NUMOD1 domain-containing DNA-binding protein n=1 Tax=Bacillus toyonensis TaxID=155322 RepID=UPI003219A75F
MSFHSVSEASRSLNIERPTLINYFKNGKQHPTILHLNITIKNYCKVSLISV